jgi:hypothetical protein
MVCLYNPSVCLSGTQAETADGVGKITLSARVCPSSTVRGEEVQILLMLDVYKPNTREFSGPSVLPLTFSASRAYILSMSGKRVVGRAGLDLGTRLGAVAHARVIGMIEAARAFVLATLVVNWVWLACLFEAAVSRRNPDA